MSQLERIRTVIADRPMTVAVATVAVLMAAFHLLTAVSYVVGITEHKMMHLSFAIALVLLGVAAEGKRPVVHVGLVVVALISILYLHLNLERLFENIGFPEPLDLAVGVVILLTVLYACGHAFGWTLPAVAATLIAYGFFAEVFGGPDLTASEVITAVVLTFGGYDMWGKILEVSAGTIFLFVLYGGIFQGLRATRFFENLGAVFGRYTRSGPAMSAVVSSALMGTTTGQTSPNIAVVGSFTIPLMKRVGYKPHVAAAIEAAASAGGQIMPPVMGAGAFVMADLLGISYLEVMKMAALPALVYFASVALYVHFNAIKSGVSAGSMEFFRRELWLYAPMFMVPVGIIFVIMGLGYPPATAGFWAIVGLLGVSLLRPEGRPTLKMLVDGCITGAMVGAKIAVACATLGPLIALVTKTGLGLEIGYSVEAWSNGNLLLGLFIMMGAVIVLGLELPTVAAYLIAAIVAIPALVRLGIDPLQAHMFAYFFGGFSALTPPVGMAALVAAKIAHAPYIRTAIASMVAASGAFIVPFIFVYDGSLLLLPNSTGVEAATATVLTILAVAFVQSAAIGVFLCEQSWPERLLFAAAGVALIGYLTSKLTALLGLALPLAAVAIVINCIAARRLRAAES